MKRILLTMAAVVLIAAAALWLRSTRRVAVLGFGPVPKDAPALSQSDIETLLSDHYTVVRRVRQIPSSLKESFKNVTRLPFDMNNPGDPMSTDAIIDAPSRQLIFAAVGSESAIVVYEQGSLASFPCAVVFSKTGAASWIAINGYLPMDIPSLRRNVHEARFTLMNPSK